MSKRIEPCSCCQRLIFKIHGARSSGGQRRGDDWRRIDERLTVLRARSGDTEAFRRLVDLYDKRLLYFVARILGNAETALDVLQTTWLIVHRGIGSLQSPDAFRVWLYRIAHDQAVSELRRQSRLPAAWDTAETLQANDALNQDEVAYDNAELVHVALTSLSFEHRRVLTLRFLEDMSIEEISEVMACRPGTVKSRLHYAKQSLRRRVEELLNE